MKNYTYKSASFLSRILLLLLVLSIPLSVFAIFSRYIEYELLVAIRDGIEITEDQAIASDTRQAMIELLQVLLGFITAVYFCMWVYRISRNAHSIENVSLQYTPGWTVGYFFIPIFNFWKPYQALRKTYESFIAQPSTNLVLPLWWFVWIISITIGGFGLIIIEGAEGHTEMIRASVISIGVDAFDLCLTGMTILVVIIVSKSCADHFKMDDFQKAELTRK